MRNNFSQNFFSREEKKFCFPKLRSNAQFFSIDLIFAVLIFILIIAILHSYWDYSAGKIITEEERNELEIISRNAINVLLTTEGMPSNWSKLNISIFNETNVNSLGLARSVSSNNLDTINKNKKGSFGSGALNLDPEKIQSLSLLNASKYETIKNILGMLGPNYEFELKVYTWDGTKYNLNTTVGKTIGTNSINTVTLNRYALLNSTWLYINFRGWQKCIESQC